MVRRERSTEQAPQFTETQLVDLITSRARKALKRNTSTLPIKSDEVGLYQDAVFSILDYSPSKKPHRNLVVAVTKVLSEDPEFSGKILLVTRETLERRDPVTRQHIPLKFKGITLVNRDRLSRNPGPNVLVVGRLPKLKERS